MNGTAECVLARSFVSEQPEREAGLRNTVLCFCPIDRQEQNISEKAVTTLNVTTAIPTAYFPPEERK